MIGAGYGGIGLAVKLKKAGIDTFTVFDSAAGPGGTLRHDTYPRRGGGSTSDNPIIVSVLRPPTRGRSSRLPATDLA